MTLDLETVPDLELACKSLDVEYNDESFEDTPDQALVLYDKLTKLYEEKKGTTFLNASWHRIVSASVLLIKGGQVSIITFSEPNMTESDILSSVFKLIDSLGGIYIITWNGHNFDMSCLAYRALKHGIRSNRFWDSGSKFNENKWNNYLSRFHTRHSDAVEILSNFNYGNRLSLRNASFLIGLPGKLEIEDPVQVMFAQKRHEEIIEYCELDVVNTFLIYLQYKYCTVSIEPEEYLEIYEKITSLLSSSGKPNQIEYASNLKISSN